MTGNFDGNMASRFLRAAPSGGSPGRLPRTTGLQEDREEKISLRVLRVIA